MGDSLYERLGGHEGLTKIADDVIEIHLQNPLVSSRFAGSDKDYLKRQARDFFGAGLGGSETYEGKDLRAAHQGMNISEQEFVAVLDDVLLALDKNGIGQQEKDEVLAMLYSMKGDIVRL